MTPALSRTLVLAVHVTLAAATAASGSVSGGAFAALSASTPKLSAVAPSKVYIELDT